MSRPPADDGSQLKDDMDSFGLSDEIREKIMQSVSNPAKRPEHFVVMRENWLALQMFLRCSSQWRYSMAGITGLDYTAVLNVITALCKKKSRQKIFDDVCLIEQGALKAIFEKRDSNE